MRLLKAERARAHPCFHDSIRCFVHRQGCGDERLASLHERLPERLPSVASGPKIPPHFNKRQQHPEKASLMSSENAVMWRDDTVPMAKVDLTNNLFPHAVVWGPLGPLTCCCPCVGHMGIADSQGRIHDFAGPYRIGVDDFMVGCVLRYYTVPIQKGGEKEWDEAVEKADAIYRKKVHDICCENCHHHTALALEASGRPQCGYRGLLSSWLLCALYGRCTLWHCLYCD